MSCSCNEHVNPLIPEVVVIEEMRADTEDVTTFRVVKPNGGKAFEHMPGQCAMISVPPLGEAIFSITSSPTQKDYMEFSVKRCGAVTEYLHSLEVGCEIGIRGPYGNNFPVEDELKGKDLLFIGGGIGLAPVRSVINYVMDNRENYGKVDILYGSRTPGDLVFQKDIFENWPSMPNTDVHLTVDRPADGWEGHVGFVPSYVKEIGFDTNKVALLCGPPIMIKYTLQTLMEIGFKKDQIYTTLELKMKCGVGKCGRCNIGDKYVCKDGPVFRCDEIDELPDEY
ncbi:MAG: sulfhydrogenase subunit gamma (sulfur reductase) [Clostridium sp.]|jgi:sulfhydrogenase subunit gamma (sulfur reductase)